MDYSQLRDALHEIVKDGEYSFYVRQWIDYNEVEQWRMKMLHDIELHDGRVFESMYPNGRGWYGGYGGGVGRFDDADVKRIRVSVRQIGGLESAYAGCSQDAARYLDNSKIADGRRVEAERRLEAYRKLEAACREWKPISEGIAMENSRSPYDDPIVWALEELDGVVERQKPIGG